MRAAEFEFDPGQLGALDDAQRRFLRLLTSIIRTLQPAQLELDAVHARVEDGDLVVVLPHRGSDESSLAASVSADEAVVSFGMEHEHFWPNDIKAERAWPVDAPDYIEAAVRFIEQIMLGRIELEVRQGFLWQHTRTYWVNDDGDREVVLRVGTMSPSLRRSFRLVRFDFGLT